MDAPMVAQWGQWMVPYSVDLMGYERVDEMVGEEVAMMGSLMGSMKGCAKGAVKDVKEAVQLV